MKQQHDIDLDGGPRLDNHLSGGTYLVQKE